MFKFLIICFAIGCASSSALPAEQSRNIVDGLSIDIEERPYQISLEVDGMHSCGGSIYSEDIIITAAHCLKRYNKSQLKVRIGTSIKESGGTLIPVANFKMHEEYVTALGGYDIAVIRLESPIKFSNTAQPIKLASDRPQDGVTARVSGWGDIWYGGPGSKELLYADLSILNIPACSSEKYHNGDAIKTTMICAYMPDKGVCHQDSGGPLTVDGLLVGVVSWGFGGCAADGYPGVYADVVTLRSWLLDAVKSV